MSEHIVFTVNGVGFEAVNVLEDGEASITIEDAIRRAGERVIEREEEWLWIENNRDQLPEELCGDFRLYTAYESPSCPGFMLYLLGKNGMGICRTYSQNDLILRRSVL